MDPVELAAPGVRGLTPYQPGKPIEALAREYGLTDVIKLASNENPLGPSARALAALASPGDLARYPDGSGHELKQALARHLSVAPDALTLGNGSNDVLELVVRAFATPAHEVVYSQYGFAVYPLAAAAVGAQGIEVPARDFGHDLEAMARAITPRTRVVFIANPNNPTGTWLAAAQLEAFLSGLPPTVIAVVDEAYFEYVEEPDYPDCVRWIERFPRLVVTRTFSKAYGLAGLRVGYAVSDPAVADLLNRVRQPFNVNTPGQLAAHAALGDEEHIARSRALNAAGLRAIGEGLARIGCPLIPSIGNFITFDTGRPAGAVYEGLLRRGVIVRPLGNYGLPNHLRVTVGLAAENARFLEALAAVLRS